MPRFAIADAPRGGYTPGPPATDGVSYSELPVVEDVHWDYITDNHINGYVSLVIRRPPPVAPYSGVAVPFTVRARARKGHGVQLASHMDDEVTPWWRSGGG